VVRAYIQDGHPRLQVSANEQRFRTLKFTRKKGLVNMAWSDKEPRPKSKTDGNRYLWEKAVEAENESHIFFAGRTTNKSAKSLHDVWLSHHSRTKVVRLTSDGACPNG
jgi:hypothetical protein